MVQALYIYICTYVDDLLCIGNKNAIDSTIRGIKQQYAIKDLGRMNEYVGCTIIPDKDKVYLVQPDLVVKMVKNFGNEIKDLYVYNTPSGPGDTIIRPAEKNGLLGLVEQKVYRSGVGMLLYLTKHSRPDISNSVRELAKVMDGATRAHMKYLHRVIKYVSDTRKKCLVLEPKQMYTDEWCITGKCDSDYAGDRDTRISVSGYLVYVNGALVTWKSRGQRTVTLSSTEAEYIALSELCTEVLYVKMLLEDIGIKVNKPIQLHMDNVGAMFLANNTSIGQRTKHIDVRYHFVRNLIEDGTIVVNFVRTEENEADVYTKNTRGELFHKHTNKYMKYLPNT